jgi:hypothetical protein
MKKFLYGLLIVVIATVASVAANVGLIKYDNNPVTKFVAQSVGTTEVSACLDSLTNPEFVSINDAFVARDKFANDAYVDSVFLSLSPSALQNVCSVLLKRQRTFTKYDIVGEYAKGEDIYNILTSPAEKPNESNSTLSTKLETTVPTAVEAPPTRAVDPAQSSSYKDTTIDGRKALIQK